MSKSIIILELLIFVLILSAKDRYEQFSDNVLNTPHNIRKATQGSMANSGLRDYGDACVYCHRPHESNSSYPVHTWNRILPMAQYQLHDNATLVADTVSLICLSCHDDTLPLDAIRKLPTGIEGNPSNVTISHCSNTCHTSSNPTGNIIFEGGNFGSDLKNHHPIGIVYDTTKNPNLQPSSNGKVGNLPLFGVNYKKIGCATCHDPHDNSRRPFLRISNVNGALCSVCHKN